MRLIAALLLILFPAQAFAAWPKLVRKEDGKIKIEYPETTVFYFYGKCYPEIVDAKKLPNGDWTIEVITNPKGCKEIQKGATV